MRVPSDLKLCRELFEAHANRCPDCQRHDGSTASLKWLCWIGVKLYHNVIDAKMEADRRRRAS